MHAVIRGWVGRRDLAISGWWSRQLALCSDLASLFLVWARFLDEPLIRQCNLLLVQNRAEDVLKSFSPEFASLRKCNI